MAESVSLYTRKLSAGWLSRPDDVAELFCRDGRNRKTADAYARLAYCIRHGLISVDAVDITIPSPPSPGDHARYSVYRWAMRGNQRLEHVDLKWAAWNWCVQEYNMAPDFESEKWDVVLETAKDRVRIECGNANPMFVVDMLTPHGERKWKPYSILDKIVKWDYTFDGIKEFDQKNSIFFVPYEYREDSIRTLFCFNITEKGKSVLPSHRLWGYAWQLYGKCHGEKGRRALHGEFHGELSVLAERCEISQPHNPGEPFNLGCDRPANWR